MDYDIDLSEVSQESEYVEALDDDLILVTFKGKLTDLEIASAQDKHDEETERLLQVHLSVNEIKSYKKGLYCRDVKFTFKSTSDLDAVFSDM